MGMAWGMVKGRKVYGARATPNGILSKPTFNQIHNHRRLLLFTEL